MCNVMAWRDEKVCLFMTPFEAYVTENVRAVLIQKIFSSNSWQIDLSSATLSFP